MRSSADALLDGGLDPRNLSDVSDVIEQLASWVRRATPPGEFSRIALSTLAALVQDGPQRISELVTRERITQPGMTTLVTRLADAGLVERRADPQDGRAALVGATAAGRAYIDSLHRARAELLARHIRGLDADQQHQLLAATEALRELSRQPISLEGAHQ